ncbi:MAG: hypothetical protein R3C68_19885 [Myxococcota bacterium]
MAKIVFDPGAEALLNRSLADLGITQTDELIDLFGLVDGERDAVSIQEVRDAVAWLHRFGKPTQRNLAPLLREFVSDREAIQRAVKSRSEQTRDHHTKILQLATLHHLPKSDLLLAYNKILRAEPANIDDPSRVQNILSTIIETVRAYPRALNSHAPNPIEILSIVDLTEGFLRLPQAERSSEANLKTNLAAISSALVAKRLAKLVKDTSHTARRALHPTAICQVINEILDHRQAGVITWHLINTLEPTHGQADDILAGIDPTLVRDPDFTEGLFSASQSADAEGQLTEFLTTALLSGAWSENIEFLRYALALLCNDPFVHTRRIRTAGTQFAASGTA